MTLVMHIDEDEGIMFRMFLLQNLKVKVASCPGSNVVGNIM